MAPVDELDWQKLPGQVQQALSAGWNAGSMPAEASALYSPWWQLETWLQSLVYVELRSAKGSPWAEGSPRNSAGRQQKDEAYRYMQSPDAQDQLAYFDAAPLLALEQNLIEPAEFSAAGAKVIARHATLPNNS